METLMRRMTEEARRLWQTSRALTATGLGLLIVFGATLGGLLVDPRVITGAPAWLKPAKFAISLGIYALTLAWVMTYLPGRRRLIRVVGWATAPVLVLEAALISLQAARGVTSHFNAATPFDTAVFAAMGVAILVAWGTAIALTVALFRHRFADPAIGWAIRVGMLITVLGSGMGGLMTRPTGAQIEAARATGRMPIVGAHTVGAPDGGSGVPGTGWSLEHGDLRVPHFLGLHAIQIVPAAAWLIGLGGSLALRRRAVLVVALSYASLFAISIGQALGGQPVIAPRGTTLTVLMIWLVATGMGIASVLAARRPHRSEHRAAPMVV